MGVLWTVRYGLFFVQDVIWDFYIPLDVYAEDGIYESRKGELFKERSDGVYQTINYNYLIEDACRVVLRLKRG